MDESVKKNIIIVSTLAISSFLICYLYETYSHVKIKPDPIKTPLIKPDPIKTPLMVYRHTRVVQPTIVLIQHQSPKQRDQIISPKLDAITSPNNKQQDPNNAILIMATYNANKCSSRNFMSSTQQTK
jgi:hypothetical protein